MHHDPQHPSSFPPPFELLAGGEEPPAELLALPPLGELRAGDRRGARLALARGLADATGRRPAAVERAVQQIVAEAAHAERRLRDPHAALASRLGVSTAMVDRVARQVEERGTRPGQRGGPALRAVPPPVDRS
ncbi:hypothetical protein PAI11_06500 [Patulibacter medicamentivorans]|uniref:Uncharacterized protein n=1 Tax=Patulibacter medicamentivorans TaxID=1097667 RepID=H0E1I8_9ACTN|nr:hypothetical protein [Patulibacter medicamentivorans]EHN12473.1 hypothetical protein PAI11_06500 [Patulibacter medicamentivorans]